MYIYAIQERRKFGWLNKFASYDSPKLYIRKSDIKMRT